MDSFERIGVNYQYACKTVEECDAMLHYSCTCCTHKSRALWHECSRCPIAIVHEGVVAILNDKKAETK